MKAVHFIDLLDDLGARVFTFNEACRVLGGTKAYCKTFMHRLVARGMVFQVEKGKYHLKKAAPLEIASNLVHPSYVTCLSALEYHGYTTQVPRIIQVAYHRHKHPVEVTGLTVKFITIARARLFGYGNRDNVFIADPEKAIIDGLYNPRHLPLDEVRAALEMGLSSELLVEHAIRFGSPVVAKRLGHLLDAAGTDVFPALEPLVNARYDPLDPMHPPSGKPDRKWHVIENGDLP